MTNASFVQTNFLGGEWSKLAQGRMDVPRYKTAMARCLNSFPVEEGSWTRRPGFRHIAPTRSGQPAKLAAFNFDGSYPYDLEFTEGHLRAVNGGVLLSNDNGQVTSISAGTPVMTTTAAETWATGDQIYFTASDPLSAIIGAFYLNRTFALVQSSTTIFTLIDAITSLPITGAPAVSTGAGCFLVANKITDFVTPYLSGSWQSMRVVQADKAALLLTASVRPYILSVLTDPSPGSPATFSLDASSFIDGPYLDAVPGSTITAAQTGPGIIDLALSFQPWSATKPYIKGEYALSSGIGYKSLQDTNLNNTPASSPTFWRLAQPGEAVSPNGFVQTDIGRLVRLYNNTAAPAYAAGTTYNQGDIVTATSVGYRSLTNGNVGNTPSTSPVFWEVYSPGWTWGRITGLSTTGVLSSSGIPRVGNMTVGGGLNAAFNGVFSKTFATSAMGQVFIAPTGGTSQFFCGLNFTGSPQSIANAIVYPSQTGWFNVANGSAFTCTLNLRGSNTNPANSAAGTLLGTVTGLAATSITPVTITSSNAVTTYNYLWVEMNASGGGPDPNLNNLLSGVFAQIQMFSNAGSPGNGVKVQLLGSPLPNTGTMNNWRVGAYSDTTGWPTCGCYHEGRLWLGGAIKNRFDASVSNQVSNFTPTNQAGTVSDSNAIAGVFNSAKINSIMWMKPDLQGIVVGTQEGEYLLQATAVNQVMTPANIQGHLVTNYGCANIEPTRTGITTMFVQKHKRRVHEYLSDIFSGRFFAPNATEFAKHLTKPGIEELAYQEELTPLVWSRLSNGTLSASTYRRVSLSSSAEPVFNGWHHHTLGSGRQVESLIAGPSEDGLLETITVVTNDPATGVRHIEKLTQIFEEDRVLTDAFFLDNAVVPAGLQQITFSDGTLGVRVGGLSHLVGKTVTAFIAGLDCGDYIVDRSQVTATPTTPFGFIDVPYGAAEGLFTPEYLIQAATALPGSNLAPVSISSGTTMFVSAVVGFTFVSQGQLLRPNDPQSTGAQQGPAFGKSRRIHQFAGLFQATQGISVGTILDGPERNLKPCLFETNGGTVLAKDRLYSGVWQSTIEDGNTYDGQIAWEVSRPYPATVAAIGGMLSTQDR